MDHKKTSNMQYLVRKIHNFPPRIAAFLVTLFCAGLLGFAFVLEYSVALTPCPLCIAQRIFFFLIGLAAAFLLVFPQYLSQKFLGIKITSLSLLGGSIALRQVWMQWHPPTADTGGCTVLFGNAIQNFLQALGGTGDCAKVDWTLLTLSIAEWSLFSFLFLLIVGAWFLAAPSGRSAQEKQ
jgi:protein dithiol:quinone oxidoreductase